MHVCRNRKLCYIGHDPSTYQSKDSYTERGNEDVQKLIERFTSHDPFLQENEIISTDGVIVSDDKLNCYKA